MFDKIALQNFSDTEIGIAIAELEKELDERAHKREEEEKKIASKLEDVIQLAAEDGVHYYIYTNNEEIYLEDFPIYCSIK